MSIRIISTGSRADRAEDNANSECTQLNLDQEPQWNLADSAALPQRPKRIEKLLVVVVEPLHRAPPRSRIASPRLFQAWSENKTVVDFFDCSAKLGGSMSFAYIDGSHAYEQSKRDFENVNRFLERGGFVIFDDSADGTAWGSHRVAKEASELSSYELVARNPNYCIKKR
jgi:Methyltransferase domain